MKNQRRICVVLALVLALTCVLTCYADTTQEEINALQQQQTQTEVRLQNTEDMIAALESQKGESEAYLSELNQQLTALMSNLETLEWQYNAKQAELNQIQSELTQARATAQEQYEDMKLRIQYLYENSVGVSSLTTLFSGDDFTDSLNRSDQIIELTKVDRQMLSEYQETILDIEDKEAKAEKEAAEIALLRQQCLESQTQIQNIYTATYNEVQNIALGLNEAETVLTALCQQIKSQQESLDALLQQAYQEELARQAAQAACQSTSTYISGDSVSYTGSSVSGVTQNKTQDTTAQTSADPGMTYLGNFTLTAYCSCAKCCGQWAAYAGTTASGAHVEEGVTVAMGGVPFGTKLSINGHIYTVQDRGTPYGHVDIYFSTHAAACAFGMQYADVYLVNE